MRKWAFLLACAGGFGLSAPAAAQVTAQDPGSVVSAMQEAGYRAQLTNDDVGDPMILSGASGLDFRVFFYNCTDNADCRTIQFYSGYSDPSNGSLQAINTWNTENRFGRAYLGEDGIARIEMDVDLDDGGMSQALFADNIEYWVAVMSKFEDFVYD